MVKNVFGGTSNWLITGGCGFIGKTLVKAIIDNNEASNIRIFDNLSVGTKNDLSQYCDFEETNLSDLGADFTNSKNEKNKVNLVVGDITDADAAKKVCRGADILVHLAASTGVGPSVENPRFDMESNITGTLNMLEGARNNGVGRFVFASSGAPLGEVTPPVHEEMVPHPVSPYGASKLAGEGYCSAYFRTFKLSTVILRFSNVYGPGSGHKSSVVAKFITRVKEGKTLEIYGDGKQTRDFIFIDDLVRAVILAALLKKIDGHTFQIATNSETTVNDLSTKMLDAFSKAGQKDIKIIHGETRLGDVKRNFSNIQKAFKMLNWKPETSLDEGILKTIKKML